MKFTAFVTIFAAPLLLVAAQTAGPGSAACDTCLAACKANPNGISQDCVTACNNNLQCNATITTSTVGSPSSPTETAVPTPPANAATASNKYGPLSLLSLGVAAVILL